MSSAVISGNVRFLAAPIADGTIVYAKVQAGLFCLIVLVANVFTQVTVSALSRYITSPSLIAVFNCALVKLHNAVVLLPLEAVIAPVNAALLSDGVASL